MKFLRTTAICSMAFGLIATVGVRIMLAQNAPATQPMAAGQPATEPSTQPFGTPLFTEDFESGKIDDAVWTQKIMGAATLTVQQDKVAHGKNALMAHYPAGNSRGFAFLVATKLPDAVKEHLFGRANIMISPKLPDPHTVLILAGTPNWPLSNFLEIGNSRNRFQLSFQQNDTVTVPILPRGETVISPTVPIPGGKWFCLEWEFNDKPDQITIWIDGQMGTQTKPIAFRNEGNSELVKGFTNLAVGVRVWGNAGTDPFDVYYDDIAIGTSRLGPVK